MHHHILPIILVLIFTSCQPILELLLGKTIVDTEGIRGIKSKHNDDNIIFKTNAKFMYSVCRIKNNDTLACYMVDYKDDTTVINNVVLTVIPGNFFGQTKMKWEYFYNSDSLIDKTITGIVEDSNQVWIHPPRSNYPFIYTEASPFPEVMLPLEKNKKWSGELIIPIGNFKEIGLDRSKVSCNYTILGKENIKTTYKNFENCWKIESLAVSKIGKAMHVYYFDSHYGFVYSVYSFPNGETLIIELEDYKLGNID